MDREARLKLIAEGAGRAANEIRGVAGALTDVNQAAKLSSGAFSEIGKAAFRAASDAARAMNDVKPINFAQSADSVKQFNDQVTRMAIRANRDIGTLKQQFRDTGKEIGVMPDRVASTARAFTKMTGDTQAVDAMAALGKEANDTDRSLEEMAEIGAKLYNDLGVPLDRLEESFKRIRGVASDFRSIGGPAGLEDSLARLAPLLGKLEGGLERSAVLTATMGRGYRKEVGEEIVSAALAPIVSEDADTKLKITKLTRQMTGDPHYQPYATSETSGRDEMKWEALEMVQKRLKSRNYGTQLMFFKGNTTALRAFMGLDLASVRQRSEAMKQTREILKGGGAVNLEQMQPSERQAIEELEQRLLGGKPTTEYERTVAGERTNTDLERAEVEQKAGEAIQERRDARNRMYRGQRRIQAGLDTAKQYLPSTVERGLEIGEAAAAYGAEQGARMPAPRSRVERLQVDISPGSIKALGDNLRQNPPSMKPATSPAAAATEANKAATRAAANF